MQIFTYTEARSNLKKVLDAVVDHADIGVITRQQGRHVVVMSLEHYNSMKETLHLMSSVENAAHLAESIAQLREAKQIE